MQKADLTTRAIAGFIDLLIVIALTRLPDMIGFLSAIGYILIRDGLFQGRSLGKKLVGLHVEHAERSSAADYRASIIRNVTLAAAYILFMIPFAGWLLGPAAVIVEGLVALGDDRGMRIGDMFAMTWVVQPVQEKIRTGQEPPPLDPPAQTGVKQDPLPEERSNAV